MDPVRGMTGGSRTHNGVSVWRGRGIFVVVFVGGGVFAFGGSPHGDSLRGGG